MSETDYLILYHRAAIDFRAMGCWGMAEFFESLCAEILTRRNPCLK